MNQSSIQALLREGITAAKLAQQKAAPAGGLLFVYFFLHPDIFAQRR